MANEGARAGGAADVEAGLSMITEWVDTRYFLSLLRCSCSWLGPPEPPPPPPPPFGDFSNLENVLTRSGLGRATPRRPPPALPGDPAPGISPTMRYSGLVDDLFLTVSMKWLLK